MATTLRSVDIVLKLLEAGADYDAADDAGRSPLLYATLANDTKIMECLIERGAEINNESLHVAARQLDLPAVKMLLDHQTNADEPGTINCHGRTPLAELCLNANLTHNPSSLKKTLSLLCDVTCNLGKSSNGTSLLYQALGNDDPLKMTAALLSTCSSIRHGLKDIDTNIYSKGSLFYSPTAYVRHFLCTQTRDHREMDLSLPCCNRNDCRAGDLERLLRTYGCVDRFWDDHAGSDQPEGYCNPSQRIVDSVH